MASEDDQVNAACEVALDLAEQTDVQFAVMVGQGTVGWAARALGVHEQTDPDTRTALDAMQRLRARLAAFSHARGGDGRVLLVTTRGKSDG